MHGMGETGIEPLVDKEYEYMNAKGYQLWGEVCAYVTSNPDNCHFIHTESRHTDDPNDHLYDELADVYVNFIEDHRCDVVFAHSMGNNVLVRANANGRTVRWYDVQGPLKGSWLCNIAAEACDDGPLSVYRALMVANGRCIGKEPTDSMAVTTVRNPSCYWTPYSLVPSCPDYRAGGSHETDSEWHNENSWLDWTYRVKCCDSGRPIDDESTYRDNILGKLCGTSTDGLAKTIWSLDWPTAFALSGIGAFGDFGEPHDGMVSISSCQDHSYSYNGRDSDKITSTGNPANPFYVGAINHQDGTCRFGNGYRNDQMPCKWYANMAAREVERCPTDANACDFATN
jgi:hypothetical protein